MLRIAYKLTSNFEEPDLLLWLFNNNDDVFAKKSFKGYRISNNEVSDYLLQIYDELGMAKLFTLLNDKNIDQSKYSLVEIAKESKLINDFDKKEINQSNQKEVLNEIYKVTSKIEAHYLKEYLKRYVSLNEKISLEFNINSNTTNKNEKPNYKNVSVLSLGQKLVAMLDFILAFSEYANDYKPLIIDQPEDNLDSRYIYENLVTQFRRTKAKRQIIIATHNATLVTNTLAEQVCVMKSDGEHGWIESEGYPGEKNIKKHIINYLEGGKESFKHKIRIYNKVLK